MSHIEHRKENLQQLALRAVQVEAMEAFDGVARALGKNYTATMWRGKKWDIVAYGLGIDKEVNHILGFILIKESIEL